MEHNEWFLEFIPTTIEHTPLSKAMLFSCHIGALQAHCSLCPHIGCATSMLVTTNHLNLAQ
jgi:hypothetical protein